MNENIEILQRQFDAYCTKVLKYASISYYHANRRRTEHEVSDLKNRTKLANETAGGLLISIHQNCLPGYPNVRGAQVFYNAVLPSQQLAEAVQQTLNTAVNTDRAKAAMPIGDGVYLMTHTTCPAILVECGFLSSPQETALLQQPSYQMKMAAVIAAGYCQYCTSEGTT